MAFLCAFMSQLLLLLLFVTNPVVDAKSFVVRTRRQTTTLGTASNGSTQMNTHQFRRYGSITVGTPAKTFQVGFNLESTDFWLIDFEGTVNERRLQRKKVRYNSSESSTSTPVRRAFKFATGPYGKLYTDSISIAGVQVPSVPFGSALGGVPSQYQDSSGYDALCPIDGELGLSPHVGLTDNNISSPLNAIAKSLSKPIVTVYTANLGYTNVGSLTFGAENTENCQPAYSYVPLAERSQWVVGLQSVNVGGKKLPIKVSPKLRVLESGLYMYGPKAQLDVLARRLKANVPEDAGSFYTLSDSECANMDKKPNVTIVVGNAGSQTVKVVLTPRQYMEVSATGECRLLFMPNEGMSYDNNYFNMGPQFMLGRCVALNWKEGTMGFAAAKTN